MVNQSHTANLNAVLNKGQIDRRENSDRREHDRRYLELPVRFLMSDLIEHKGILYDISAGGMRITSEVVPSYADLLIVYIDGIGRFEGKFIRSVEDGFAVQMILSPKKAARLEQSIDLYFKNYVEDSKVLTRRNETSDRRGHRRVVCDSRGELIATTDEGHQFRCNIINMSLGGMEISSAASLDLGQKVRIGTANGRVSRKTANGYAIVRV